jgi:hypothetical protein
MSILLNLFYENYVYTSFRRYFFVPADFFSIFVLFNMQKSPGVLFLKENSLKHKLNKMCSGADELCNVNFVNVQGSTPIPNANKIDRKRRNNAMNQGSCTLFFC